MKKDKFISFDGTNQTFADIETNTKKLSIFEVYVVMDSQATCDRMKQLCIDNGLDYYNFIDSFSFIKEYEYNIFYKGILSNRFLIASITHLRNMSNYSQVTEKEFIELLKEYKNEKNI